MTTRLTDLQIPDNWMAYTIIPSSQKSPLIDTGVIVRDTRIDVKMQGGNTLIDMPHFNDLADEDEDVSSDDPAVSSSPSGITSGKERGVRLSRNKSWSSMDLNSALTGEDPMAVIEALTSGYWRKRMQALLIATAQGVFNNNAKAAPGGGAVQDDMTVDASILNGGVYLNNVTNFTAEGFIDATHTMGDAQEELGLLFVHPTVHARMLKADLIDFRPDSEGRMTIETFQGRRVVISRKMPSPSADVYESWIFGPGAFGLGVGTPDVPAETQA